MRKNRLSMILIVVMAVSYLAIGVRTAEAGVVTADSCDDFSFWTQRLCTKYCEKLDCDSEIPHDQTLRRWLCKYYGNLFEKKTGIEPPCACAHSPTETGEALNPNCDPYVDCACIAEPTCCSDEWDDFCTCLYDCVAGQGDTCCAIPSMLEQSQCRQGCYSECTGGG